LVQHLAVTFAALSLVRERQIGLTDVFRVSPLSPGEAVTGKYLGFGTISAGVAVILSVAMWLFGVEVRGSVAQYFLVIVVLILASLGLGFALSGLSRTDTQAVQYSMLVLLVSIFFTGFVLPLDRLAGPVQVISYLIPATYGIRAIHDVVFRGVTVDPLVLAGLLAYALAFAAAAWWAVRRDVELVRS
jgi:ABC-2 type transport system permease protein